MGSPPLEFPFFNRNNPTTARSDFAFGEIRGDTSGYEFDATILEVAFHDNADDAAIMRDPVARDRAAQSTTQATIRYFNEFGGGSLAFAPDAPTNVRTSVDRDGNVTVRWNAPATSAIFGGAPTGYRVYASRDGYGFDGGAASAALSATFTRDQVGAGTVYFKVVATNAGGESPASAVVAARVGDARMGRILIVNGFDRQTRQQNFVQSVAVNGTNSNGPQAGLNTIERVRPRYSNSFDYAVQHAQAIANHPGNLGVDTADNSAIIANNVSLSNYRAVIWILGEESTANRTFDATEQAAVTMYLSGGGKLFASGAEIGWDLEAQGNGASFFNNALRSDYASDDANTFAAAGVAGSIFAGLSLGFDNGTHGTYLVDFPDRLTPINGSTAVLSYSGGAGGTAATAWSNGSAATLVMGFPFETITDGVARAALMRRALDWFGFTKLAPVPAQPQSPSGSPIASAAARAGSAVKKSPAQDLFGTPDA